MNPEQYTVYKVNLSDSVWNDPKFVKANPNGDTWKPGCYIGTTGKSVEERFKDHKAGIRHNKYVKEFGKSVEVVSKHPTWAEAHKKEIETAVELRKKGIGVFQK